LKDADGLDRARLFDLNPDYLRHRETRAWVEPAHRLYQATWALEDPAGIWEAAAGLGLPVEELLAFVAAQRDNLRENETLGGEANASSEDRGLR
jgi:hypothetical protein